MTAIPLGRQLLSMNTEYLTPAELASMLKIEVGTLAKQRCCGGGPRFIRVGRAIRYDRADVELWLQSRSGSSCAEIDARTR